MSPQFLAPAFVLVAQVAPPSFEIWTYPPSTEAAIFEPSEETAIPDHVFREEFVCSTHVTPDVVDVNILSPPSPKFITAASFVPFDDPSILYQFFIVEAV